MEILKGKSYEVKDWFGNRVANELRKNISMCEVFNILKETDKAIYAILNCGCDLHKTMWVPKSVLVEYEVGFNSDDCRYHYETHHEADYNKAMIEFNDFWELYK